MKWENVQQCIYKGWTIIDNGYGFQAYGTHGERLFARCSVDEILEEIDEREKED